MEIKLLLSIIWSNLFYIKLISQTPQENRFGLTLMANKGLPHINCRKNVSVWGYFKTIWQFCFWGFEADGSKVRNLALKKSYSLKTSFNPTNVRQLSVWQRTEVGRAPLTHFQKRNLQKGFLCIKLARKLKFYA